jgi:hypothetical protein
MDIRFRTLTPVFTGDKNQKGDRLHETGLLGSLRFWAAAAARGLGYSIATDSGTLPQKTDKRLDVDRLDPVTRLFGCTGWRRAFNLKVAASPDTLLPQLERLNVMAGKHGWYLTRGCLYPWDQLVTVRHIFRKPLKAELETEGRQWLALVWDFIDRLAGVGAHQGWGYGQVRLETLNLTQFYLDDVSAVHGDGWPDLADFLFAEYEFDHPVDLLPLAKNQDFFKNSPLWDTTGKTPSMLSPVGLSLRYLLQYPVPGCPTTINAWGTKFFGGAATGEHAGRFHGSLLYKVDSKGNPATNGEKYRFRIWAWLPKSIFKGEAGGLPAWCNAAQALRDALLDKNLWTTIAGCAPPKECHFWPLTSAKSIPALSRIAPLLGVIENRGRTTLCRKCV